MGTRGEIYVRNAGSTVELWRHYDTYKDYMKPYFELFARYAAWAVGSQRHWLTYPEDVAAMLIAFDYEVAVSSYIRLAPSGLFNVKADLRPRGSIDDFETIWILDIPNENQTDDIVWKVSGFDLFRCGDVKGMREAIRSMNDSPLRHYARKTCQFTLKPENRGGCRTCGYPGPLLLIEDPPLCLYCLAGRIKRDEFVRKQFEQIVNIASLVSGH